MKSLIYILLFTTVSVSGDPATLLVGAAEQLLPYMKNKTIYAHAVDSRFGFDLEPLWKNFFRVVRHRDFSVRRVFESGSICEISAAYRFDPLTRRLTLSLYLYENSELKQAVEEIPVTAEANQFIPEFSTLFDRGDEEDRILYRGNLDDRLSLKMKNGQIPGMMRTRREFQVGSVQAVYGNWKNQVFLELLRHRFGIRITTKSSAKIDFDPSGTVVFSDGEEVQFLLNLLPPQRIPESRWSRNYLTSDLTGSFERISVQSSVEQGILDRIELFFSQTYPKLFSPFQADRLLELFYSLDKPMILNGIISQNQTVHYQWVTPRAWVGSLDRSALNGRVFEVACAVREIIQDTQNPYRFWVIADQQWRTLEYNGSERYRDSGFLVVNFDCNPEGEIESIKIHYRLWIYNYPIELGAEQNNRIVQLKSDLSLVFSSVNGVESTVKEQVKKSILEACNTF